MKFEFLIFEVLFVHLVMWLSSGGEPLFGEHLIAYPLSKAIDIRAHIISLEKRPRWQNKKIVDREKKLSKVREALKIANKETKHLRSEIWQKYKVHTAEKAKFIE